MSFDIRAKLNKIENLSVEIERLTRNRPNMFINDSPQFLSCSAKLARLKDEVAYQYEKVKLCNAQAAEAKEQSSTPEASVNSGLPVAMIATVLVSSLLES